MKTTAKTSTVQPDEREKIISALRDGKSQNAVAKTFGRGVATVSRIAQEVGLEYSAPKRANEARHEYALAERIELGNKLFRRVAEKTDDPELTSRDLKDLAVAFGVLIDKRRLEDGQSTGQTTIDIASDSWARMREKVAALLKEKDAGD